ncbi:DNA repair protein RadA [Thermaurantimonas aggregans]|uniref:DNA repair protein RadA n=2 Tax=Thermaurantimonas aggregans TaxID=2173829 RepID=A0A401XM19_9FLAO|nr:DNA repair protein RadA [Thermaurantimonas aggregans]
MGKCTACGEWNTLVEEVIQPEKKIPAWGGNRHTSTTPNTAVELKNIEQRTEIRLPSGDVELDRVLGGGIVPGSLVLVGGEPGIGKSTLMLQVALRQQGIKVLYVSGEESPHQIRMRAERIAGSSGECLILSETAVGRIFDEIRRIQPDIVIVDSIQTLYTEALDSAPGSVSQIRESATEFMRYAKSDDVPVFLIGHITKDGQIAGPKVLEHMVDVVLQFEGDRNHFFRILRAQKNRFGSTSEIGIYEMKSGGLEAVSNPSDVLLSADRESLSGNSVCMTLEGVRPLPVEVQALVSTAVYGTPQRSATGFDVRRLNMLLAVLEKRCGFRLGQKDVFLNIAGGIRVDDPALDASVVASILSSNEDVALSPTLSFAAEVGLSGEVRPVSRIETRIAEAERLGFTEMVVSKYNKISTYPENIKLIFVSRVDELYRKLF